MICLRKHKPVWANLCSRYDQFQSWWFNRLHHRIGSRTGHVDWCSCGSGRFPCEARRGHGLM